MQRNTARGEKGPVFALRTTHDRQRRPPYCYRNPILVSYVAKGLLPHHGLGSGIKRALDAWPQIEFIDDHDGCRLTATVHWRAVGQLKPANLESKTLVKRPVKKSDLVLKFFKKHSDLALAEVAETIGKSLSAVERASAKLVKAGRLKYVGPRKGGHWEVIEWQTGAKN